MKGDDLKAHESKRPMLGAHVSIGGGVSEALLRGRDIGCECIQMFTKSSRQWASKPYPKEEIERFKQNLLETAITTVIAHDSYLVNLGAPDHAMRKKSVGAYIDELERCEQLGVPFLVTHPGAHVGAGEEAGIATIAKSIDEAHSACPGYRTRIALEITAGQGSNLGYRFEQMRRIFDAVKENHRLRLCFDTEHAFAAGYDLSTDEGYERTFGELDRHIGIELIVAFHLNDSVKPLNSRVDRHQHIGKGHIGLAAFKRLMNDGRFFGKPMCLETPTEDDYQAHRENLATLRSLFD
ncbi:MAG TPA: deoxyribonuclease IV [Candidatus Binataceae bacterium]